MKKYMMDVMFVVGFISFEYGLYLIDPRAALIVGGVLSMVAGVMGAKNGVN